jgi:hypothetical protein
MPTIKEFAIVIGYIAVGYAVCWWVLNLIDRSLNKKK